MMICHSDIMGTRICSKCGEEKPETTEYFYKNKASRGGLNTICKECKNKAGRRWRSENPEKVSEKNRRWYAVNPEKVREKNRRWHAENHEKSIEKARIWKAENPEKVMEAGRRWRDTLAPAYLKSLISAKYDIDRSGIGDELINAKRRELKYYRQLNQLKK